MTLGLVQQQLAIISTSPLLTYRCKQRQIQLVRSSSPNSNHLVAATQQQSNPSAIVQVHTQPIDRVQGTTERIRLVLQLLPECADNEDLQTGRQQDYHDVRVVTIGLQHVEQAAVHEQVRAQLH